MKRKRIISMLSIGAVAILALALLGGSAGAKSNSAGRSFHGTVAGIAKNKGALTITTRSGALARFIVRASTTYEHVAGIGGISKGDPVEVKAVQASSGWVATRIELNPGGSGGSGSDDPPGDDHGSGGHGSDDPPGDDHGSGGHGSDD